MSGLSRLPPPAASPWASIYTPGMCKLPHLGTQGMRLGNELFQYPLEKKLDTSMSTVVGTLLRRLIFVMVLVASPDSLTSKTISLTYASSVWKHLALTMAALALCAFSVLYVRSTHISVQSLKNRVIKSSVFRIPCWCIWSNTIIRCP